VKIAGLARKRHVAPVAADTRVVRGRIALDTRAVGADACRHATDKVLDEDVLATVCISRHEIASLARKRHIAPIAADARGVERTCTSLSASSIGADACRSPTDKILDEDIPATVGVSGNEIACAAQKCHVAGAAADTRVIRVRIALHPRAVGADACRHATDKVLDEDVLATVCISRHEIASLARKRHIASVAADTRSVRVRIALHPRAVRADACRHATDKVLDEDVLATVCISRHKIASLALKRHITTVAADARAARVRIALHARSVSADACRRATDKVLDENIRTIVCVTRNEVTGIAIERHVATVAADTRFVRVRIALHARSVGADACHRATDQVLDEDIPATVGISGNEIACAAPKCHIAGVVADAWVVRTVVAT